MVEVGTIELCPLSTTNMDFIKFVSAKYRHKYRQTSLTALQDTLTTEGIDFFIYER
jgi:hypothetical protein